MDPPAARTRPTGEQACFPLVETFRHLSSAADVSGRETTGGARMPTNRRRQGKAIEPGQLSLLPEVPESAQAVGIVAGERGARGSVHVDPEEVEEDHATGQSPFISIPVWCRRVGCSLDSGYRAARRNEIPGLFRIGRLVRVNWDAFVATTTAGTPLEPSADQESQQPGDPAPRGHGHTRAG